jgi:hypothetical protein
MIGPMMVGLEERLLDMDEVAILVRGPKFCVRRIMCEERYLVECEISYFKVRLDMEDDDSEEDDDAGGGETDEERIDRERVEKVMELAELEAKTVFNEDEMSLDYGRKRATDCKHNTCIKLPRPKSAKVERDIEYRRLSWKKIYSDFGNMFTDEDTLRGKGSGQAQEEGQ